MKTPIVRANREAAAAGLLLALGASLAAGAVEGQGCAPVRVAGAILGTDGDVYLRGGTWQLGLAFRRLTSNRLIQGGTDLGPSSVVKSQSLFASVKYGVSDQLEVAVSLPVSYGTHETAYPDGQRHQNQATGIGDLSLVASYWLFNANTLRPGGNVAVGLGVKLPTGKNDVGGTWWNADGSTIPFPVHQSIELGDGGWGVILRTQAFQPILSSVYLYGGGSYTLSPQRTSSVPRLPGSSQYWAIPDVWDASAGVSWTVWPAQGLTVRIGTDFSGTRKQDLLGEEDDATVHRLPATAGYLSPGLTLTQGAHTIALGFSTRIYKNFMPSIADDLAGRKGGGGLAKHMVTASYVVRP